MILQPQVDYPIVRQIANHLDNATYYVQAVVRDADGTTLATVNLVDQGGQRFQRRYRVPADRSGQGTYISVVTSVYTDSGYTTKSSNYGDEETTYLIFDRVMPAMRGGGGGNLDAGTIRRIVGEELDKREKEEKEIEFPEIPEAKDYSVSIANIQEMINSVKTAIEKIPTERTDLTHVLTGIQNLAVAIDEKEVTPETDLTPVLEEISNVYNLVSAELEIHQDSAMKAKEDLQTTIVETIRDGMENTEFTQEVMIRPKRMNRKEETKETQPKKEPFNIRQLVS